MAISNFDDIIDSREVIDRIAELEEELEAAYDAAVEEERSALCHQWEGLLGSAEDFADKYPTADDFADERSKLDTLTWEAWIAAELGAGRFEHESDWDDLKKLRDLADEASGCSDWEHGEALIRESHFRDYAEQLAEDIGAINSDATWPNNCIDWERAARELRMDYTAVDFDGVTYLIRS
jgi:antirestriction protein